MHTRTALLVPLMMAAPALALAAGHTPTPKAATGSTAGKAGTNVKYKQPVPSFKKVDSNGDHEIEWNEAKSAGVPKAVFKRYDYHHDGKLTLTEWKMVKVAMVDTTKLHTAGSKSLPKVPASIAKKVRAPAYGTVTGTAGAPMPSTGNGGHKKS